eukprot:scaffold74617_cov34-Tisochrysis_lutea.AAC.3
MYIRSVGALIIDTTSGGAARPARFHKSYGFSPHNFASYPRRPKAHSAEYRDEVASQISPVAVSAISATHIPTQYICTRSRRMLFPQRCN